MSAPRHAPIATTGPGHPGAGSGGGQAASSHASEEERVPLLRLSGVGKSYPSGDGELHVLQDIDLDIHAGEMLAIVGQSGSGKSTLMHILGCLDRPGTGTYQVRGVETSALDPDELAALRREHFGFIFQRYHLLGHLSAIENVAVPAAYLGMGPDARGVRAKALLSRLGLGDRGMNRPGALSGGQQQRVSIARALMNGGEVIFADEPTGALDSKSGSDVMNILRELHQLGHTVIIVTHDMKVAAVAERIVEISDGRIIADRPAVPSTVPGTVPVSASADDEQDAAHDRVSSTVQGEGEDAAQDAISGGSDRPLDAVTWRRGAMDAVSAAWSMMERHRLRTALTMLSIMMGIAAVVCMVAFGQGAQMKLLNEMKSLGADATYVYPGKNATDEHAHSIQSLRPVDVDLLRAQPYVDSVSGAVRSAQEARYGNEKTDVSVSGVSEDHARIRVWSFAQGGNFTKTQMLGAEKVAVIDNATRKALFASEANVIGKVLFVGPVPVTIVGVLAPDDSGTEGLRQPGVYMPASTVQIRMLGQQHYAALILRLADGVTNDVAEPLITALLTARHGKKDFYVESYDKFIKNQTKTAEATGILTLCIALVSLLIAGIGVMNIMLVAVSERTGEIGIRMAVGARRADIQRQFLTEALMLCTIGGLAGVLLSFVVMGALTIFAPGIQLLFSLETIFAACFSSTLIGVAFGYFPARNAARLDPIKALAHD